MAVLTAVKEVFPLKHRIIIIEERPILLVMYDLGDQNDKNVGALEPFLTITLYNVVISILEFYYRIL